MRDRGAAAGGARGARRRADRGPRADRGSGIRSAARSRGSRSSTGGGEACYVPRDSAAWPALAGVARGRARAEARPRSASALHVALRRDGHPARRDRRRLRVRLAPHAAEQLGAARPRASSPSTCSGARCPRRTRCAASAAQRKRWAALPVERAAELRRRSAPTPPPRSGARSRRSVEPRLLAEYLELADTLVRMELTGIARRPDELDRARAGVRGDRGRADAADRGARRPRVQHQLVAAARHGAVRGAEAARSSATPRPAGAPSIEALERIEHAHPIVALVLRWRAAAPAARQLGDRAARAASTPTAACTRASIRRARSRATSSTPTPISARVPGRTPEMAADPPRVRRAARVAC